MRTKSLLLVLFLVTLIAPIGFVSLASSVQCDQLGCYIQCSDCSCEMYVCCSNGLIEYEGDIDFDTCWWAGMYPGAKCAKYRVGKWINVLGIPVFVHEDAWCFCGACNP